MQKENKAKLKAISILADIEIYYQEKNYANNINTINKKINYIEKRKVSWSKKQDKYVEKLLTNIKNDIIFFEMIQEEYNAILKEKISKEDLLDFKKYYREKIQQKFIDEKIKEVGL